MTSSLIRIYRSIRANRGRPSSFDAAILLALLVARRARPGAVALLLALVALGGAALPVAHAAEPAPLALVASTYLGGGGSDRGRSVGLDAQGNIYVVGETFSSSFMGRSISNQGSSDIFVAKLSPDARQLLALFTVGSVRSDTVGAAVVTPQGEVVIAVATDEPSFPTKNPLRSSILERNPGVLLKVNAALDGLVFSTFTDFTVETGLRTLGVDAAGTITAAGYFYTPANRGRDMAVQRFSPDGQRQLFGKVWDGDTIDERAQGLVVLPDGTTYITGYTDGRWGGLAVTANAFQQQCGRRLALGADRDCDSDAFVMRLTPAGTVDYATYLGGNGDDRAVDIGVDGDGAMVILGTTSAVDFPTTAGAHQPKCRTPQPDLGCYYDLFVAKLTPAGDRLAYSTYLASGDASGLDYPSAIAVDQAGNATVTGTTASELWPVKRAVQSALAAAPCPNAFQDRLCFDAVVTTLSPDGQLMFSSYLGGRSDEYGNDVAVGADGSIYLAGITEAADFPTVPGAVQPQPRSGDEAFLARLGVAGPETPGGTQNQRVFLPLLRR